jgi:hypothetical protein
MKNKKQHSLEDIVNILTDDNIIMIGYHTLLRDIAIELKKTKEDLEKLHDYVDRIHDDIRGYDP